MNNHFNITLFQFKDTGFHKKALKNSKVGILCKYRGVYFGDYNM